MIGELVKKAVRTVYGEKVCRVTIDVPYDQIKEVEEEEQDMLKWLDNNVDKEVSFSIGPFDDEEQNTLHELEEGVAESITEETIMEGGDEEWMEEDEGEEKGQGDFCPPDPEYDQ